MDFFAAAPVVRQEVSLDDLIAGSVASIRRLFDEGYPTLIAFSSGKDSSVLMILTFMAAIQAKNEGRHPKIAVCHSNTGIENPLIAELAKCEMKKIEAYAAKHGLDVQVRVAQPELLDSWGPRICGGRALPSYPGLNADCSVAWKCEPSRKLRHTLSEQLGGEKEVVVCTGTRRSESVRRGANMLKRKDSSVEPVRNKEGELVLSPIAEWDTDSVFELLGLCGAGIIESYTDAQEVLTAYRDAGPTSCAVVNDSIMEGEGKAKNCGARFGFALCTVVQNDSSMDNLLNNDPQYGFMRGLGRLRNYLMAIQNDMGRRLWVGRTIREGHIAIRPDVFSPEEMRRIYRYAVTLDAEEEEAAQALGIEPRFRLIPPEAAVCIDMLWSRDGHFDGFAAVADYLDIWQGRERYPVPEKVEMLSAERPEPRFLEVGENWAEACGDHWAGIREPFVAAMLEDCLPVKSYGKKNAVAAWADLESEDGFVIDQESLAMFFHFEADGMVRQYRDRQMDTRGIAYRWYLQYGLARLSARQILNHDKALRRTAYKRLAGVSGPEVDVDRLFDAAKPWDQVPASVQASFLSESRLKQLRETKESEQRKKMQASLF